jgi:hypothetical protein
LRSPAINNSHSWFHHHNNRQNQASMCNGYHSCFVFDVPDLLIVQSTDHKLIPVELTSQNNQATQLHSTTANYDGIPLRIGQTIQYFWC